MICQWRSILIIIRCKCFFLFIGREPTTWPANNCLQTMVCSCAMSFNCFFPVSSSIRAAILHECQNYLGGGGCLGGSEKNRGTVITSVQLAFRRRDRNFTPFFHSLIRKSASDEKHAKHISIYLACLQISPFETVILYSFWAIPPNKTLQACTGKTFS